MMEFKRRKARREWCSGISGSAFASVADEAFLPTKDLLPCLDPPLTPVAVFLPEGTLEVPPPVAEFNPPAPVIWSPAPPAADPVAAPPTAPAIL